jgi:hypothetical protein
VFAISKKIKNVKEIAKKRGKNERKKRRFERLQGVVLRICYQKFHVHILSWSLFWTATFTSCLDGLLHLVIVP